MVIMSTQSPKSGPQPQDKWGHLISTTYSSSENSDVSDGDIIDDGGDLIFLSELIRDTAIHNRHLPSGKPEPLRLDSIQRHNEEHDDAVDHSHQKDLGEDEHDFLDADEDDEGDDEYNSCGCGDSGEIWSSLVSLSFVATAGGGAPRLMFHETIQGGKRSRKRQMKQILQSERSYDMRAQRDSPQDSMLPLAEPSPNQISSLESMQPQPTRVSTVHLAMKYRSQAADVQDKSNAFPATMNNVNLSTSNITESPFALSSPPLPPGATASKLTIPPSSSNSASNGVVLPKYPAGTSGLVTASNISIVSQSSHPQSSIPASAPPVILVESMSAMASASPSQDRSSQSHWDSSYSHNTSQRGRQHVLALSHHKHPNASLPSPASLHSQQEPQPFSKVHSPQSRPLASNLNDGLHPSSLKISASSLDLEADAREHVAASISKWPRTSLSTNGMPFNSSNVTAHAQGRISKAFSSSKLSTTSPYFHGFSAEAFVTLLWVKPALCNTKMDITVDDLRFIGFPVLLPKSGLRANSSHQASSSPRINNYDSDSDLSKMVSHNGTSRESVSFFNMVCGLRVQGNEVAALACERLTKALAQAFRHEEIRSRYLSMELESQYLSDEKPGKALKAGGAQDQAAPLKPGKRSDFQRVLYKSLRLLVSGISGQVIVNSWLRVNILPAGLHFHENSNVRPASHVRHESSHHHYHKSAEFKGSWMSEQAVSKPAKSSSSESDDSQLDKDEPACALYPFQAFLPLERTAQYGLMHGSSSSRILHHFLQCASPFISLEEMQITGIPLHTIIRCAHVAETSGLGKVVDTITLNTILTVNPKLNLGNIRTETQMFAAFSKRVAPKLSPSFHDMLNRFSRNNRFQSHFEDLEGDYAKCQELIECTLWLLQRDIIVLVHEYVQVSGLMELPDAELRNQIALRIPDIRKSGSGVFKADYFCWAMRFPQSSLDTLAGSYPATFNVFCTT